MLDLKAVAADFDTIERRLARRGEKAAQALAPARPLTQRRRELNVLLEKQKKEQGEANARIRELAKTDKGAVEGARHVLRRTGRARMPDCLTYRCRCAFTQGFWAPFPSDRVRLTSIYSKGDGVVRWQAQRVAYADCVEVTGSHVGLVFNRKSYRAIAGALAAPEL